MPRTQTHKGHTVAVLGVHIRLNLENKPRDFFLVRGYLSGFGWSNLWTRAKGADARHQFPNAERVDGRAEPDRGHCALMHRAPVKGRQKGAGHIDLFAQGHQQIFRHVQRQFGVVQSLDADTCGDPVPIRAVHQFQAVIQKIITPKKIAPHADRPAGRGNVDGKVFLYFVNNFKGIATFTVHFVTKCQDRQIAQATHFEQFLRLAFHTLRPVNHHDGRINRRQRAIGILGKIGVAGGVHQIEPEIVERKGHGRGGNGNAAILFHLHVIRARSSRLALGTDLSGHLDRPAIEQEFFRQGRLARIRVADDCKGASALNLGGQLGLVGGNIVHIRGYSQGRDKGQARVISTRWRPLCALTQGPPPKKGGAVGNILPRLPGGVTEIPLASEGQKLRKISATFGLQRPKLVVRVLSAGKAR